MCPGRNYHKYVRNMSDGLITLIPNYQLKWLHALDIGAQSSKHGIKWIHFPMRDFFIPRCSMEVLDKFISLLLVLIIKEKKRLVIHCNGGHGRTGIIVACLLLRLWLMDFSHRDDRDEGKPSFPSF